MEEKAKRRVEITIAGISMALITDESESFVNSVVSRMNESMEALLGHNSKMSQLDAAMLCAIGFCGDKIQAEKRVRNLEAQISLYDVNLRRMRDENIALRKHLEGNEASSTPVSEGKNAENEDIKNDAADTSKTEKADNADGMGTQMSIGDNIPEESPEAPVDDGEIPASREEKLKLIESLLRK